MTGVQVLTDDDVRTRLACDAMAGPDEDRRAYDPPFVLAGTPQGERLRSLGIG